MTQPRDGNQPGSSPSASPSPSPSTSPQHQPPANRPSTQHAALSGTGSLGDAPVSLRPGEDAEREAALRRMKAWATSLLLLASVIFVVAKLFESRYPWLGIVIATA